jgi:hypothetical protein
MRQLLTGENDMEPKYSLETIRRYREIERQNGFERAIQERTPVDLEHDELILECGHKLRLSAKLLDARFSLRLARGVDDAVPVQCDDCVREWLQKAETSPPEGDR